MTWAKNKALLWSATEIWGSCVISASIITLTQGSYTQITSPSTPSASASPGGVVLSPRWTLGSPKNPGEASGKEPACQCRVHKQYSLIPGLGRSRGEGNGNPPQYSCLENPVDRGVWQATVHGVAKSLTRLKRFSTQELFKKERMRETAVKPPWHHKLLRSLSVNCHSLTGWVVRGRPFRFPGGSVSKAPGATFLHSGSSRRSEEK